MRRFVATLILLPALAMAQCPDYTSPVNTPVFSNPGKKSFRHFGSTLLAGLYKPWRVHDEVVKTGTAATIVGKFDYDAVLHKDLEGEYVHVYITGTGLNNWQYVGRYTTDSDGKISASLGVRAAGEYQVRMVEGDLSTVKGYLSVVEPGRQAVLFDIDGTLTINDFEAYADYVGAGLCLCAEGRECLQGQGLSDHLPDGSPLLGNERCTRVVWQAGPHRVELSQQSLW